jgi:signal transduction histidine kinase
MSSAPLPGESRHGAGAVVMIYDISRVKRLEQNVQRAHRLSSIGTMAAGMAHEIKNPLVSIKTFTQLLLNRYHDEDFRQTFSDVVPNEVERIDTIVSQLLDFARPRPTRFDDHDIREVVAKVLRLVENQARKKDVELVVEMPDEPLDIRGDEQQLHQVFLNLVLNAVDAMGESRERRLTVSGEHARMHLRRNGHVPMLDVLCARVVIRDTGCGIAAEELDGIFTPFFTTKEFGTGLGLSVVHGIVTDHGGQIDVESVPGRGTTFTVSLPAAQAVAARDGS